MASFVQLIGSNNSKTSGASLVISPSSKTVTQGVGRMIFVAFATDDGGSSYGVSDNLGNVYTLVKEQLNASNVRSHIWSAPITVGGSITTITISWTTNVVAKGAVAAEFAGVGTLRLTDGNNSATNGITAISSKAFFYDELWIAAYGVEDDVAVSGAGSMSGGGTTPPQTMTDAGSDGTASGGSASNIFVTLTYVLIKNNSQTTGSLNGLCSGTQDSAGAGAIYNAPPSFLVMFPHGRG